MKTITIIILLLTAIYTGSKVTTTDEFLTMIGHTGISEIERWLDGEVNNSLDEIQRRIGSK